MLPLLLSSAVSSACCNCSSGKVWVINIAGGGNCNGEIPAIALRALHMNFVGDKAAGGDLDLRLFINADDGRRAVALQRHNGLQKAAFAPHALKALVHALAVGQAGDRLL